MRCRHKFYRADFHHTNISLCICVITHGCDAALMAPTFLPTMWFLYTLYCNNNLRTITVGFQLRNFYAVKIVSVNRISLVLSEPPLPVPITLYSTFSLCLSIPNSHFLILNFLVVLFDESLKTFKCVYNCMCHHKRPHRKTVSMWKWWIDVVIA